MCHSVVKMRETAASALLIVGVIRPKVKEKMINVSSKLKKESRTVKRRGEEVRIERMK